MKPFEDVDPEMIDHAVGRVCSGRSKRAPGKEAMIAQTLGGSRELMEWVQLIAEEPPPVPGIVGLAAIVLSAISIGMEVGYELGAHEARRAA